MYVTVSAECSGGEFMSSRTIAVIWRNKLVQSVVVNAQSLDMLCYWVKQDVCDERLKPAACYFELSCRQCL